MSSSAQPDVRSHASVLGLPLDALIAGLACAVMVAGFLWIRRITHGDPEPRIFRATTHADPTEIMTRPVIAAAIAFVVVLALGLAVRL